MIKSMTGYGRAQGSVDGLSILIELKSVNSRYLDCNIRTPRTYEFLEEPIKAAVSKYYSRGKCDIAVTIERSADAESSYELNMETVRSYLEMISRLQETGAFSKEYSPIDFLRLPEVLQIQKDENNQEEIINTTVMLANEALRESDEMRIREGNKLCEDVLNRVSLIESIVSEIETEAPKRVEQYRERLYNKMLEVIQAPGIDEQRILQEAAIYSDRVAVDEETVRLHSHFNQLREMMKTGGAVGRKVDFLIQEMNRETNTIGSKSNDLEITKKVVDIKSEIEKIREQIQNVE